MNFFVKLWEALFAEVHTPEAARRWRFTVAILLIVLAVGSIWAIGAASRFGVPGFAYAGDVEREIDLRLGPLVKEQAAQRALLTVVSDQLKDTLSESKAAEIRGFAVKRCHEQTEPEKEILNREIDRAQAEFFKLVERYYRIPACGDL